MREHGQRREIVNRNYSGTVKDSVFVKSFIWWSTERERNTVLTVGREKKIWHPEQGTFLIWFSLDAPILLIRRLDETIKTISFFFCFCQWCRRHCMVSIIVKWNWELVSLQTGNLFSAIRYNFFRQSTVQNK